MWINFTILLRVINDISASFFPFYRKEVDRFRHYLSSDVICIDLITI